MNSSLTKILQTMSSKIFIPSQIPVRHRYYAERIANGPFIKKYGYKEKLFEKGPLPRLEDGRRVLRPEYKPKNSWTEERALKGQNDYIDILGDGRIHPSKVLYEVPCWLRGVQGNEYQLLLRKRKMLQSGILPLAQPTKWRNIRKRITFLYKFLNRKTKSGLVKRE